MKALGSGLRALGFEFRMDLIVLRIVFIEYKLVLQALL